MHYHPDYHSSGREPEAIPSKNNLHLAVMLRLIPNIVPLSNIERKAHNLSEVTSQLRLLRDATADPKGIDCTQPIRNTMAVIVKLTAHRDRGKCSSWEQGLSLQDDT